MSQIGEVLSGASRFAVLEGDMLDVLPTWPEGCVSCAPFSPPYWRAREYGVAPRQWADGWFGCLGREPDPLLYVVHVVECLEAVKRVLHPTGTVWLNVADSYMSDPGWGRGGGSTLGGRKQDATAGAEGMRRERRARSGSIKQKDMCLIPERLVIALQDTGWYVRSRITWEKETAMPSSVGDRPTPSTEPVFLLAKNARYYYDTEAVKERAVSEHVSGNGYARPEQEQRGGRGQSAPREPTAERRLRDVWSLGPDPMTAMRHAAPWPEEVPRRCVLLGTSEKGYCPRCMHPWRRRVQRTEIAMRPNSNSLRGSSPSSRRMLDRDGAGHQRGSMAVETKTLGWEPMCKCGDAGEPVAGIVLDPFSGTGRTLEAALRLGLRAVGVELNREWAEQSRARLAQFGGPHMFPTLGVA